MWLSKLLRERVDELKALERYYSEEERSHLMTMLEQSQRLLTAPIPVVPVGTNIYSSHNSQSDFY